MGTTAPPTARRLSLLRLIAGVVSAPIALERAVENVHFADNLGTFPVEVRLCHDGRSTLDTGLFGKVYWDQTGPLGFGARARATGPPQAGGTLASYVSSDFIQTNVALIDDPDVVVDAYGNQVQRGPRVALPIARYCSRGSSAGRSCSPLFPGAGSTRTSRKKQVDRRRALPSSAPPASAASPRG